MEFSDLLASQNMLKLQTKPIPTLVPFELRDFQPQELKTINQMNPKEVMESIKSNSKANVQGLSADKLALAEHVTFQEDNASGGTFKVISRLNMDCKKNMILSILSNIANGLDCRSFEIKKEKNMCIVSVILKTGDQLELGMLIGFNESKERILTGTYPESHAAYGRQFWIRFAGALSKHGCLMNQTPRILNVMPITSPTNVTKSNSGENERREDLPDDPDLEYDSSEYNSTNSENSVDSDIE